LAAITRCSCSAGAPPFGDLVFTADGIELCLRRSKVDQERAMELAEEHYRALGYEVENTAATRPYDLHCTREGLEVTRRSQGDARRGRRGRGHPRRGGERGTGWRTDLFVVSGILVDRAEEGEVKARGGSARIVEGWRAGAAELKAIRLQCMLPSS
jgi:hypothetical protein